MITGKKNVGPETEKKSLARVGLNPLLRWLTTVCLRGFQFDRNVQQLLTVFSLHQCLQCIVMNEQKQLSISNQHNNNILFKFLDYVRSISLS